MTEPNERTSRTSRASFNKMLREAQYQSAARGEILAALGRDIANPGAVLDTIVEQAARLCGARAAQLFVRHGDVFRVLRMSAGTPAEYRRHMLAHPIVRDRTSSVGRAAADMCTNQIADVREDPEYGRKDLESLAGFRTLLSTPMILEDEVVGVLSMWRTDVAPFAPHECELLEDFAAQGAIALRQRDLMRDLSDKVAQLEALREVGEAVGSSLDLDEVLDRIVGNAVRLTNLRFGDVTLGTDGGSIMEYDESSESFHVRSVGSSLDLLERLRAITIHRDSTLVGRTALAHRPLEVPDLARAELDPHLEILFRDGWRSVLAVPMLRGETMVGVLVIRRRRAGTFPRDVVALLEAFASQSALAIVNARLFGELETKTRELEIASRHKSEFLASMSHELRTPLNAVIGFSDVLLKRMFGDINPRQEEYLHDILHSGEHLLELIKDILDLSKVEGGQMEFEPSTFAVSDFLEGALTMFRERAAQHAITLTCTIADGIDLIETDELRLKQVMLNLVSNAVKFTPDGGCVSVLAVRVGDELEITVSDTGPGVPPEDQERIFEAFQQGGRGPSKAEGTGLGLTLSRRMVDLLGGRMWLMSTVGVGSTFGMSIPGLTDPRHEDAAPKPGGLPVVVVLDEDRASQDLVTAYLDGFPIDLVRAWDGGKAAELVRTVLPAAVVLEIGLPRCDGWQVIAQLKAESATAAIPVIIASTVDDRPRGLALGAAAYLLKPVRRDELIDALRTVGALAGPEAS